MPYKNYSYDPEDVENNVILTYVSSDLMKGNSKDPLRSDLGFLYSVDEYITPLGAPGGRELKVNNGTIRRDTPNEGNLRENHFIKLSTNSKYIKELEIMPSRIEWLNTESLLPNYVVPVRMYAKEGVVRDDKFWRTLFVGGTYGEESFSPLIETDRIFRNYAFTYANSYTTLYAKNVGIHTDCPNLNVIQPNYNSYNLNIKDYQLWCKKLSNPLLIPSVYTMDAMAIAADIQSVMSSDEAWVIEGRSYGSPLRNMSPELQLYSAISASSGPHGFFEISVNRKLVEYGEDFQQTDAKGFMENIYFPRLREVKFPDSQKERVVHSQKNILFANEYYRYFNENGWTSSGPNMFPYFNVLSWPRHGAGSGGGSGGAYGSTPTSPSTINCGMNGLHNEQTYIRDHIAGAGADAKFLESLKDVHNGIFPGCSFVDKECSVEYSGIELVDYRNRVRSPSRTVVQKTHRSLDLLNLIQKMHNNPEASLNDDYTFAGAPSPGYKTTYSDNKLYRYYDNSRLMTALSKIYNVLNTQYAGLPQPTHTWTKAARLGDTLTQFEASMQSTVDIVNYLFNCNFCHAETLAYRVEKTGGITTGDYTKPTVLQNFWMWNASTAGENMILNDTQVKYGEDYTYKVYAYVAVVGHRYKYSNFRLTKQIATLDTGPDSEDPAGRSDQAPQAPDGDPEYYCLQFYDPITGEYADQLFNDGTGEDKGSAAAAARLNLMSALHSTESILRGDSQRSALAQRNRYATNQVDISESPHLADFHVTFEPCIKLIEIPLFKKKLKILDNPAHDMVAIPFQYMDASKQIGFNMRYENFNLHRPYPISITKRDLKRSADYHNAHDIIPGQNIPYSSISPQRYIEVFRTTKKPTTFSDFENKLVDTIDLQIEDSNYSFSDTFYKTKIPTNRKFYYVFRFLSENLVPGHMSQILECELVDDGDYIYAKFDVLADQLGEISKFTELTKGVKKIFQIEPNMSQVALNTSQVDFGGTPKGQIVNLKIGDPTLQESIWDQKFKIRLTSQKTSKQIDINVTFELKDEDRTTQERGGWIRGTRELSFMDFIERWNYLTGFMEMDDPGEPSARPGVEAFYYSLTAGQLTSDGYDASSVTSVESFEDFMMGGIGDHIEERDCVIATNAVANGIVGFVDVKARSVEWCRKNLHGTWYGEAWRRGYRDWGRKAIRGGPNPKVYEEFQCASDFITGHNITFKGAWIFARRSVQFFLKGLFIKEESGICS